MPVTQERVDQREIVSPPALDELAKVEERAWEFAEEERSTQAADLIESAPRPVGKNSAAKQRPVPDQDLSWQCRQQAAVCQAELGEASEALRELRALRAEEQQVRPPDSPELFSLRQQTAMLAAGVGDVVEARREPMKLLHDITALHSTSAFHVFVCVR